MSRIYRSKSAPCLGSSIVSDVEEGLDFQERSQKKDWQDEYQQFEINTARCCILYVTIIQGFAITRGRLKDWLYRPDPYVRVSIVGTPNQPKQTRPIESSNTPKWDETLSFYIDPHRDHFVEFALYDMNRTVNEEIGRDILDISKLRHQLEDSIITFRNSEISDAF